MIFLRPVAIYTSTPTPDTEGARYNIACFVNLRFPIKPFVRLSYVDCFVKYSILENGAILKNQSSIEK